MATTRPVSRAWFAGVTPVTRFQVRENAVPKRMTIGMTRKKARVGVLMDMPETSILPCRHIPSANAEGDNWLAKVEHEPRQATSSAPTPSSTRAASTIRRTVSTTCARGFTIRRPTAATSSSPRIRAVAATRTRATARRTSSTRRAFRPHRRPHLPRRGRLSRLHPHHLRRPVPPSAWSDG